MLEHGRAVAYGPLAELTSRPDLPWLRDAVGLGSVFDARSTHVDADRGLCELAFDGGTLVVPDRAIASVDAGSRAHPGARSVLATSAPTGLSLHNVLAARSRRYTTTRQSTRSSFSCVGGYGCWRKSRATLSVDWRSRSAHQSMRSSSRSPSTRSRRSSTRPPTTLIRRRTHQDASLSRIEPICPSSIDSSY